MATSKIKFTISDGNLFSTIAGADHVSSLVFDVATPPTQDPVVTLPLVYQVFSLKQAQELGLDDTYEDGVVEKHISDFFAVNPNGELYVGLADMSTDFTHLTTVQTVAQGRIRQQGVFTKQDLFTEGTPYTVNHVGAINAIAKADADNNKPYSVMLHANVASVNGGELDYTKIPTAIGSNKRVSINIGQENDQATKDIQTAISATVGCVGAFMGAISLAQVHESIGWTSKFNISSAIETIAFGWGTVVSGSADDNTPYSDLDDSQLDSLVAYGYTFPHRYTDFSGVFAVNQKTLSSGDYNTIARNRTADKSRRNIRVSLLPTIQQPLYVNAETGNVAFGTINQFKAIVHTQLAAMQASGEISGFGIEIDPSQNILSTNTLKVQYRIVPVGTNDQIEVELGFSTQV